MRYHPGLYGLSAPNQQVDHQRSLRRIEAVAARVLGVTRVVHVSREEAGALIIDCTEQPIQRPGRTALLVFRQEETPYDQNRNRYHREWPDRQHLQTCARTGS